MEQQVPAQQSKIFTLTVSIICFLLFCGVFYFLYTTQKKITNLNEATAELGSELKQIQNEVGQNFDQTEKDIDALRNEMNEVTDVINEKSKIKDLSLAMILYIEKHNIEDVAVTKFNSTWNNDELFVIGQARSRGALLAFKKFLEGSEYFSSVYLPPKYLMETEIIDFEISAKLK